jgi:hypothetical protein
MWYPKNISNRAEVGEGWDAGSKGAIITVEEIRKYWN